MTETPTLHAALNRYLDRGEDHEQRHGLKETSEKETA
jgi:hypothetical protein